MSDFKKQIIAILNQDVQFLGTNFDKIEDAIPILTKDRIYDWTKKVVLKEIKAIHKKNLLVFRYPFSIGNTEYGILLIKVKKELYIEFHLGDHKYYDKTRKSLNLNDENV